MKFIKTDKEHEYHLLNGERLIGKGFIFENESARFYDKPRMDYFIEFDLEAGNDIEEARAIVNGLIQVARRRRKIYEGYDARVYNCSFSENDETINFYKSIVGFKADEGMHVLDLDTSEKAIKVEIDSQFDIEDNTLDSEEMINELLKYHGESFRPGLYIKDDLVELKKMNGFKCLSIRNNGSLIANLIVFITEEGNGFLEDMFVNEAFRGNGLGKYLVNYASDYMLNKGVKLMNLEVWSNNYKAYNLYKKMGYKLGRVSEVSIGMSI